MSFLSVLFPRVCPVCLKPMAGKRPAVHDRCLKSGIYVSDPFCMSCGRPMKTEEEICEQCIGKTFPYDAGRCVFLYHSRMGKSVAAFKSLGVMEVAAFFGAMAAQRYKFFIESTHAAQIVPVPVSRRKLRIRGFNQSQRLAEALSYRTGIPMVDILEKTRDTKEQKSLSRHERLMNLQGTFAVREGSVVGKSVIVVDDIFTTGSTVSAVASVLKKAGALHVYFICAASAHT